MPGEKTGYKNQASPAGKKGNPKTTSFRGHGVKMEFVVKFFGDRLWAVSREQRRFGLDFVDQARRAIDLKDLSIERIGGKSEGLYENPALKLSEDWVRKHAPHRFCGSYYMEVHVPEGYLTKYLDLRCKIKKDSETGEILQVSPEYRLNQNELLMDWATDDCPAEWGFQDQDDE